MPHAHDQYRLLTGVYKFSKPPLTVSNNTAWCDLLVNNDVERNDVVNKMKVKRFVYQFIPRKREFVDMKFCNSVDWENKNFSISSSLSCVSVLCFFVVCVAICYLFVAWKHLCWIENPPSKKILARVSATFKQHSKFSTLEGDFPFGGKFNKIKLYENIFTAINIFLNLISYIPRQFLKLFLT